jgi:hypothetical protein
MADTSYELAIFGSTPLSGLVAGLLGNVHQKKVCIVGDVQSAFRLARGIDLSVMPVTRPETWALLKEGTAETLKLLARLGGRAAVHRIDPILVAETPSGNDALAHMRHVALGFGYAVERSPGGGGVEAGTAYRLRDAVFMQRQALQPLIEQWLAASGVGRIPARGTKVTLKRDGSAKIESGAISFEASKAVLCDDAAILAHLDVDERDRLLISQSMTTLLTEPAHPLAAPVMIYPDRGVTLSQGAGGNIVAFSAGRPELAMARVGECLISQGHLRCAGQTSFRSVLTVDGAPLIGQAKGLKSIVIAGLGISGAFLAPVIARFIAGVATDREQRYFGGHEAGRGSARSMVAEYQSAVALEGQL